MEWLFRNGLDEDFNIPGLEEDFRIPGLEADLMILGSNRVEDADELSELSTDLFP
jgi:hypothetical protein